MTQTHQGVLITRDVPCRQCAYNLRGLAANGRCPECGQPVALSINGDLLCFSDPNWVAKLRTGALIILASILGSTLSFVLALAATYVLRRSFLVEQHILGLLIGIALVVGAWLLTEPDPSGVGERDYGRPRRIVRVTLLLGLADHLIRIAMGQLRPDPIGRLALAVLLIFIAAGSVAGTFALLLYLAKLAGRIPSNRLAGRARSLTWGYGGLRGLVVLGGVVLTIAKSDGARAVLVTGSCAMMPLNLMLLVAGLLYVLMLNDFKKEFRKQEKLARNNWKKMQLL